MKRAIMSENLYPSFFWVKMGKESDNIFGLAGSQRPKREGKPQPVPVIRPQAPRSDVPLPAQTRDFVLKEALARVQQMHDDLEQKVQMVYTRMGLTKATIKQMLDNPKNYERVQLTYENAQTQRRILREEIIKIAGVGVLEALEGKAQQKELERHKKKSLGTRKNWLNMR